MGVGIRIHKGVRVAWVWRLWVALGVGGEGARSTLVVTGEEIGKRTAAAAQTVMDRCRPRLYL
jgi:hypothetical protein